MDSLSAAIRALDVQHSIKAADAPIQKSGAADVVQAVLEARRADGGADGASISEVSAVRGGVLSKVGLATPTPLPNRIQSLLTYTAMIDACVREVLHQSDIQITTDARMLACLPRRLADTHQVPIPHTITTSYATALVHACIRCTILPSQPSVSPSSSAGAILLGAVLTEFPAHGPIIGSTLASCLSLSGDKADSAELATTFIAIGSRLRGVRRGALRGVWNGLIDATVSRVRSDTSKGAATLDTVVWGCLFQTGGDEAVVIELWDSLREVLLTTRKTTSQIVHLLAAIVFYDGPERHDGDVVGMRASRIRTVYQRLISPVIAMWGREVDVQSGNDIITTSTGAIIAFLLTAFRPVGTNTSSSDARVVAFRFVSDDVDVDVDVEDEMVVIPLPLGDLLGGITYRFKSYRKEMRKTAALVALLHARVSGASDGDQPLHFDEFPDVVEEWLAALPGGRVSTTKEGNEGTSSSSKKRPTGLIGRVERAGGASALRWNATVTIGLPSTIHIPSQPVHDEENGVHQKRHTPFGLTTDAGDEGESQVHNDGTSSPSSHGGIPKYHTLMDAYRAIVGLGAKPNENERERADCIEGALRVIPTLLRQELTGGGGPPTTSNPSLSWMPTSLTFKSTTSTSLQRHAPPPSVALQSRLSTLLSPIAPQLTVALIAAEGSYPDDVQQYLDQQRLAALSLLVAACPYVTLHRLSTMLYHNNYSIHQRVLMYHSIRDAMTYLQEVPLLSGGGGGSASSTADNRSGRHQEPTQHQHQASYPPIPVGEVGLGIVDASDVCMPHLQARREQRAARRLATQSLDMAAPTTTTATSTTTPSARHNAMARARIISANRVEGRTRRWGYAVKGRRAASSTPPANSENQLPIYAEAFLTALLQFHDGTDRPTPSPPTVVLPSTTNTTTTPSSLSDSAFSFMGEEDAQYCPGELLRCVITLFEGLDSPAAIIARSTANPSSSVTTQLAVRTLPFLMKAVLHPHGVVRGYAWWAARIVLYTAHKSAEATQDAQGSLAILQHMQMFIRAAKEASAKETVLLARDAITQFLAGLSTSAH